MCITNHRRYVLFGAATTIASLWLCSVPSLSQAQTSTSTTLPPVSVDPPRQRERATTVRTRSVAPKRASRVVPRQSAERPPAARPATTVGTTHTIGDPPPAYAGGQVATGGRVGFLGNLAYANSPFSSVSYTSELIRNQQATSVGDVLLNDPTVRVAQGFGNFAELYIIRGFPLYGDDLALNGLYGIVPRQFVAAPLVERVEILRGVSAFVNGAAPGNSGVGGSVNLVPKRAPLYDLNSLTIGYESSGQVLSTIDVARRFGDFKEWGVRVGATGRTGETSVDGQDRKLGAASLDVDYNGENARFSADLGYQDHHLDRPRPQVGLAGAPPSPPTADQNYAQPWTYANDRNLFFVTRGEVDLTESVTAWASGGFRFGDEDNVLANPTATSTGSLSAYRFDNVRKDTAFSGDAGVRATFDTGPVGHRVVVSGAGTTLDSKNAYAFSNFAGFSAGTLYNPVGVALPAANYYLGGVLSDPLTTEKTRTSSFAVADTMSFLSESILLTLGGRYQKVSQDTFNYNTGALGSAAEGSAVTPVVGLVVKPLRGVSLFANYAEALQRGGIAPATSGGKVILNAGEALSPYVSKQYEVGAKFDGGNFGATLSLFSITQQQAIVENQIYQAAGEQRNRGVELSFYGEPVKGVRLLGGVTGIDPKLQNTQNGLYNGNNAVGVPRFQGNLGAEWDLPFIPGMTVDGRLIYTGKQYTDAANINQVDSWTRLDLGLRYATAWNKTRVTYRFRVLNLANESYWASVGGYPGANYLVQGAPRTFLANMSVDF
ncbi:MAG: TonB-dependent receptor [Rhodopseudomonas sp.]|uniref:TonB-dependent receptor n=1 Tax=Rhodopseudomonas sp. TaxID=1078 RepID=UPI0039E232C5